MACGRCNFCFSFWAIFCPFTPNSPKIQNFFKNEKIPGGNIILHMCTKNYDQMLQGSWDGETDRPTEKVTYRGGCPPKNWLKCMLTASSMAGIQAAINWTLFSTEFKK